MMMSMIIRMLTMMIMSMLMMMLMMMMTMKVIKTMNLPRKVGTEMRRKTKRHPLLVYKLVFATTRAANRVHFVLKTKFFYEARKNFRD